MPQHFIGMSSLEVKLSNGEVAEVRYNLALSLLSLVLTLSFVGLGMYICSLDRVFTMTRKEIVEDFVAGAKNLTIRQVQQMSVSRILCIIGTNELHYLLLGGFTTSAGVVIMHYTGLEGVEVEGHNRRWNVGIIAASIIIAFVAATTAFWILFRVLPIYPNKEILRQAAALVMSCAVLGTHYVGMLSANFVPGETTSSHCPHPFADIDSQLQFEIGVGFAVCVSVLTVIIPLADLRYSVQRLCYELSRADDLILSLPLPEQSVSSARVRKYVMQRKACRFNTNVITDTHCQSLTR
jgi:NO-binding membrane sensor protein with MHYT domain